MNYITFKLTHTSTLILFSLLVIQKIIYCIYCYVKYAYSENMYLLIYLNKMLLITKYSEIVYFVTKKYKI